MMQASAWWHLSWPWCFEEVPCPAPIHWHLLVNCTLCSLDEQTQCPVIRSCAMHQIERTWSFWCFSSGCLKVYAHNGGPHAPLVPLLHGFLQDCTKRASWNLIVPSRWVHEGMPETSLNIRSASSNLSFPPRELQRSIIDPSSFLGCIARLHQQIASEVCVRKTSWYADGSIPKG